MGANAATKCYIVVNNVKTILAIELLNASQALYFRAPYKTSQKLQQVLSNYRQLVPQITNDRYLHDDIKKSVEYLDQL
jgi:histidine ammonia-lyase